MITLGHTLLKKSGTAINFLSDLERTTWIFISTQKELSKEFIAKFKRCVEYLGVYVGIVDLLARDIWLKILVHMGTSGPKFKIENHIFESFKQIWKNIRM
jgi:hypothetical protein